MGAALAHPKSVLAAMYRYIAANEFAKAYFEADHDSLYTSFDDAH